MWNAQSGIQRGRRMNRIQSERIKHTGKEIFRKLGKNEKNCVNPKWVIQTHTQSIFLSLYKFLAHFLLFFLVWAIKHT